MGYNSFMGRWRHFTFALLCITHIGCNANAWLFNREMGYYDYPARIYGGVDVVVLNPAGGADSKHKPLRDFLYSGGAKITHATSCQVG